MADERFTNAARVRNAMTSLIASEGWSAFDAVLEEKIKLMFNEFTDPGKELSDITLREHRMAIATISTIRALPRAMLADAEETIERFAVVEPSESGDFEQDEKQE